MSNINREELYLAAFTNGLGLNFQFPNHIEIKDKDFGNKITKAGLWAANSQNIVLSNNVELTSIFEEISINGKKYDSTGFTFPVAPLSLDKNIFPNSSKADISDFHANWIKLQKDIKKIPPTNFQVFSETLYYVLKKYLSCLAVDDNTTYVNLFEFLKVRAAIAQSLYDVDTAKKEGETVSETMPLLLACADISGIQDFIYNITSKKASKSLKGRSFYLTLLMESITRKIIEQTDTTIGHILYSSGGKMYMILPNTEKVKKALSEIEKKVINQVYKEHKKQLYVLMDYVEFGFSDQQQIMVDGKVEEKLGKLWNSLTEKTAKKKNQKFKELYIDQFNEFFEPYDGDGFDSNDDKLTVCAVTGERISKEYKHKVDNENDDIYVTPLVKKQWELGSRLQDLQYFITHIGKKAISQNARKYAENPLGLEYYHYVKETSDFINEVSKNKGIYSVNNSLLKRVNGVDFFLEDEALKGTNAAYGFTFYGGNNQAYKLNQFGHPITRNGRPKLKDFEELANHTEEEKHKGFHRLGILRMDVDGLGGIFANGLDNVQSLAAYSTLSAQLDLFFSGYLNTIRDSDKYKDNVNILYSGGDDLFVIGKWDLVVDFAEEIRNEFRRFVCNREDISISGGIALVTPKFPIAKAAEMAGEEEKKAKGYKKDKNSPVEDKKDKNSPVEDKNALTFLGVDLSWDFDYPLVKEYKNRFIELLSTNQISMGILQKILIHSTMKEEQERLEKTPRWIWMVVYDLSQASSRVKTKEAKNLIKEIQQNIFTNAYDGEIITKYSKHHFLKLIATAVRWAELENRNIKIN